MQSCVFRCPREQRSHFELDGVHRRFTIPMNLRLCLRATFLRVLFRGGTSCVQHLVLGTLSVHTSLECMSVAQPQVRLARQVP